MRRIAGLLIALSKDWLRNREAVFFSIMFPVVLLLIFSAVFGGGSAGFTVYVQNNDLTASGEATDLSAEFVDALDVPEALTVREIEPGRNVTAWSRENGSSGSIRIVVVPDGFAERVRAGSARARQAVISDTLSRAGGKINASNRAAIQRGMRAMTNGTNASAPAEVVFLSASDDEAAPAVRGIVQSVVAAFNDEAIGVETPPTVVTAASLGSRNLEGVDYYLPALIAAVVMINGVITVTAIVAEFSAEGVLKRIVATPLRKRDWIAANVVLQSALALLITGIMVLVAHLVFDVTVLPGPGSIALVLLGAVGFSALGIALGSLVGNPEAATSLGMAIALPMMFLSGVFWELDLMPEYLQTVATVLPLYHFHQGLRRLMVLGTTEGTVVPFAVLGVGAVLSLALAVRVTNWRDL